MLLSFWVHSDYCCVVLAVLVVFILQTLSRSRCKGLICRLFKKEQECTGLPALTHRHTSDGGGSEPRRGLISVAAGLGEVTLTLLHIWDKH